MENLSTGQNLGQNSGRSSYSPSQYGNQMAPPLGQPDSRDEGENEEDNDNEGGGGNAGNYIGKWQKEQQKARNSQSNNASGAGGSEIGDEKKMSGQGNNDEGNKEGISALLNKGIGEAEDIACQATGEALKQSWINIWETYGLTFLYINIHYIVAYLGGPLSRFFPKAGREWLGKTIKNMPAPKKMKKDIEESIGKVIEPFEIILAVLINAFIIFFIFAILFICFIIVMAVTDPYHTAVEIIKNS